MTLHNNELKYSKIITWIQEGVFLVGCFLFLLLIAKPILITVSRPSVFFLSAKFFNDFIFIPGGLIDWISALFMQFWFSNFLISFYIVLCLWLVMFLTKKWIEGVFKTKSIHSIHLIPSGILLAYHTQYESQISVTLALIVNFLALVLFLRWAPKNQNSRTIIAVTISIFLFWITGAAFFIFAMLLGIDEILRKRFISGIVVIITSSILPFIAINTIFLVSLRQAFSHNLIIENPLEIWYTGYLLLLYYPVILGISSILSFLENWKLIHKLNKISTTIKILVVTIIVIGGCAFLAYGSINDIKRYALKVNYAVNEERWNDVLALTKKCPYENPLVLAQQNLALFQRGMLLDSMFSYPQSKGSQGLLVNENWSLSWADEVSEIYWRLGLVNTAQHWAHEALEHKGPTADILKRLGMVYMIKGEHEAAKRFFLNLRDVPFQQSVADRLLLLNENPVERSQDSVCRHIQASIPVEDLNIRSSVYIPKLELLLKRNPKNKMAFEYLIAYHLLNSNVKGVSDRVLDFVDLSYPKIPRYVQEAMLVIVTMIPKADLNQLKRWIEPSTFNNFVEYRKIIAKYKGNKNNARSELLAQFGDTYWYYLMYGKMAPLQSEGQNEYQ